MDTRVQMLPASAAPRRSGPGADAALTAFWYAQGAGWTAYFLLHYAGTALDNDYAPWWASFASALAGFALTSAMRPALLRVSPRGPALQVATALALALLFAVPYSAVSEQAYWLGQGMGWRPGTPLDYLGSAFWCGSILLTWTGVYFGLRYYHEAHTQQLHAARAISQAKEARLAVLRERLNPHFLFNALNGVSTLVLEDEKERAATMLDQLCSLLRHSIEEAPSQQITLAEELELADLYLRIQQTRFEHRLRVEWRVAPQSRRVLVPSMILQPLLENAVRYGVQPDPNGATISIATSLCKRHVTITVDNTLRIRAGSGGNGIGQRNVRERLAALYGRDASFDAGPVGNGYRAALRIPEATPS